jgi:hypothetical protein
VCIEGCVCVCLCVSVCVQLVRGASMLTSACPAAHVASVLASTRATSVTHTTHAHTHNLRQVYDAKKGTFTELGMLDVQQIFGRAGRPQFDTSGEATIITTHSKLAHYLGGALGRVCVCVCCGVSLAGVLCAASCLVCHRKQPGMLPGARINPCRPCVARVPARAGRRGVA